MCYITYLDIVKTSIVAPEFLDLFQNQDTINNLKVSRVYLMKCSITIILGYFIYLFLNKKKTTCNHEIFMQFYLN